MRQPGRRQHPQSAPGPRIRPKYGMAADSGFQPSVPRLSVAPVCYGCKACDWELTALWAGASSGRPAEGHRRRRRRVRARWPTRSSRAWRRSDGRNRQRCGMRPIPVTAGAAATHARPPRARAAARVLRGAQRALPRAAGALLPARLLATATDLTASLHSVPSLPGSQVAGGVFFRVPRGAILLPVMAGGAWRRIALSMLVHFAAATRKVARRLSRVALRPGTGRLVNARIQLIAYSGAADRRRLLHIVYRLSGSGYGDPPAVWQAELGRVRRPWRRARSHRPAPAVRHLRLLGP